jgi:hypothetical protein
MPTIIKISVRYSGQLEDTIKPMCEKIISRNDEALLFPLPGYVLPIIKHLSAKEIQYELSHDDPDRSFNQS